MSSKKVIVVAGATGAQGGSVVRALLKDGGFEIRAITRDTESEKAKQLVSKGVSVFKADYSDKESLRPVLKGAYGFYAMTAVWDPATHGKEVTIGKLMVDVAVEEKIQHFVWSSLPNVAKESNNKYDVPHFTDKAIVEEYARSKGLFFTAVAPSFYFSNFQHFFAPKKDESGTFVVALPIKADTILHAFDVDDTGEAVLTIFKNPNEWKDKFVPLYGEGVLFSKYIETLGQVTGVPVRYQFLEPSVFEKSGAPGAHELSQMFQWFNEYSYFGRQHDLSLAKKANPNLKSFAEWLKHTQWVPK